MRHLCKWLNPRKVAEKIGVEHMTHVSTNLALRLLSIAHTALSVLWHLRDLLIAHFQIKYDTWCRVNHQLSRTCPGRQG